MDKETKIILADGTIIKAWLDKEVCCGYSFTVSKGYFLNEVFEKSIKFTMWDDFSIIGFSHDKHKKEVEDIEFSFSINDPLYFPLNRLLMHKNPLVIDDDDTYGFLRKYMEIKKEEASITVKIFNKMANDKDYDYIEKWRVFIKNIGADPRSKIEDNNIKYNLVRFFREAEAICFEEYHQITMDEYLETIRIKKLGTYKQD